MKALRVMVGFSLWFVFSSAQAGMPLPPPAGNIIVGPPWGNPLTINFPNQAVGTTSAPQDVTLTAQLIPADPGWGVRIDSITTAPIGEFNKGAGCNNGTVLNSAGACTYPTTFTPSAEGPRAAVVSITCSVVPLATIVGIVCNGIPQVAYTMNGTGFALSNIPALSQTGLTLLSITLFGFALYRMRRG